MANTTITAVPPEIEPDSSNSPFPPQMARIFSVPRIGDQPGYGWCFFLRDPTPCTADQKRY